MQTTRRSDIVDTDPTPAEIALLARLEYVMRRTHDTSPTYCRWTETAKAALAVVADWQAEQVAEREVQG